MTSKSILIVGLLGMLSAVILGAFGAHVIADLVSTRSMQTWNTAAEYQFYHALGLIGLALWSEQHRENAPIKRHTAISAIGFIVGLLLFCGSLYVLVLSGYSRLGLITPLGGLAFILGWGSWLIAVIKLKPTTSNKPG